MMRLRTKFVGCLFLALVLCSSTKADRSSAEAAYDEMFYGTESDATCQKNGTDEALANANAAQTGLSNRVNAAIAWMTVNAPDDCATAVWLKNTATTALGNATSWDNTAAADYNTGLNWAINATDQWAACEISAGQTPPGIANNDPAWDAITSKCDSANNYFNDAMCEYTEAQGYIDNAIEAQEALDSMLSFYGF